MAFLRYSLSHSVPRYCIGDIIILPWMMPWRGRSNTVLFPGNFPWDAGAVAWGGKRQTSWCHSKCVFLGRFKKNSWEICKVKSDLGAHTDKINRVSHDVISNNHFPGWDRGRQFPESKSAHETSLRHLLLFLCSLILSSITAALPRSYKHPGGNQWGVNI